MKKVVFFFFAILAIAACKKESQLNCIGAKIEEFKLQGDAQFIRKIELADEEHFWFKVYADPVDHEKISWILDASCDTVCHTCTGWCANPACFSEYNSGDWQTIWEN